MAETSASIAIIGMAGRFPGADDVVQLWSNLRAGLESIAQLSDQDLAAAGVSRELLGDARYVKARGILSKVELFDAEFFGMSPREAELTDPQHRLFLECSWEALESAGYDPARVQSPIGVFAGSSADGYLRHHILPTGMSADGLSGLEAVLGNDRDYLSTRVAYKLDLRGPSLTVQTACSTSLVAVQLACQSLLSYQCDMALAGGVSIAFPLNQGYLHQPGHILSADGHCRAFDAAAVGPVGGDGVGAVVLKRLEDAIAAGDHIHAVVLAAATNNDGSLKAGYSAPGIHGQAEVVALTHAIAGLSARTVSYLEAHGTGTPLGDPIEISALTQAFRATTHERGFCALGSLKTNLGHLNTAAGVASLIKAALAIEHGEIPASLNYTTPNPQIDFAKTPFFVNATLRAWPGVRDGGEPRRAGVSSFGIGGTNAHVLLEEAPRISSEPPTRPWQLLVLSARSEAALEQASLRLAAHLDRRTLPDDAALADVAYTLQVGRRAFAYRRTLTCRDAGEASLALRAGSRPASVADSSAPQLFFLFPDQSAQHASVGRELYAAEPVFREHLDRAAELLLPQLQLDLRAAMFGDDASALGRAAIAQPASFAFAHALARLWMSWGVHPAGMLGDGAGEWVAACLAGVFSFDDALTLVLARGRLLDSLPTDMDSSVADFAAEVARVPRRPAKVRWISSLTGTFVTPGEAGDPSYWGRHLLPPERFKEGLAQLDATAGAIVLEVGPGDTVSTRAHPQSAPRALVLSSLPARLGTESEAKALLDTLGRLWSFSVDVDFGALHAGARRRRRPLPTYPFERKRHWIEARTPRQAAPIHALESVEAELCRTLNIRPLESYPGLVAGLSELCASHIVAFLRKADVELHVGVLHRREVLRQQLAVLPKFARLFDAMLDILAAEGVLRDEGDELRWLKSGADLVPPAALQRAIADRYPQFAGLLDFLAHCAASYPEALTGRIEAIAVLYPGGSSEWVAKLAQRTAEYRSERIYLRLLEEAVVRLRAARPGQKLRILEIGGGQGMLTWPLISALAKTDSALLEYHFTDVGKVFVDDARREAARRGLDRVMTFGLLDIAKDPSQQEGCLGRTFDVVVAYNVIHAVRHVPQALDHLQRVLTPGGTLAFVEAVRVAPWDVLTWGLAEGFWYYDDGLRTDSALLPLDRWEEALRAAQFENVIGYPRAASGRARMDHGLVLAQRSAAPLPVAPEPRTVQTPSVRRSRPDLRTPYAAPRNELERRVAGLCAELFGVERVGVHDDFFELGADSLVTLRLADLIRSELGRELSMHAAFRGATVASMVQTLADKTDSAEESSPLVPIQSSGTRPPFFFVHPVLGVAFGYVGLSRALGADQPFYGLQALGLDGQTTPDLRLEDTAARYVKAIRTVAPAGPYYLGGYSFGCSIAFEMAQQLTRAGEKVALLALVDGPAPVAANRPALADLAKLLSFDVFRTLLPHLHDYLYLAHVGKNGGKGLGSGLRALLARATIASLLPPDSQLLALRQPAALAMFRLLLHHFRQARAYAPPPYAGPISFFKATEPRDQELRSADPAAGWSELAAGGIELHEIAADHFTILIPPRLQLLADKLSASLREAQNKNRKEAAWTRFSSTV